MSDSKYSTLFFPLLRKLFLLQNDSHHVLSSVKRQFLLCIKLQSFEIDTTRLSYDRLLVYINSIVLLYTNKLTLIFLVIFR